MYGARASMETAVIISTITSVHHVTQDITEGIAPQVMLRS